jgi:hypothetical protein
VLHGILIKRRLEIGQFVYKISAIESRTPYDNSLRSPLSILQLLHTLHRQILLINPLLPRNNLILAENRLPANLRPNRLVHRAHKQHIHLFKRDTLGFRHKEETPHAHCHKNTSEEEIRAVPQIGNHIRRAARNDERSEPRVGCSERDTQHPDIEREDLGCVRPCNTLPRRANDEAVDIYGDHSQIPPTRACDYAFKCGTSGIILHDISADIKHRDAAQRGAPYQTLPAPDALDDEKGEGAHPEGLRDAVEARGEEFGTRADDAEGFEDTRGIVRYDIHASEGLEEHERKSNRHTIPNTLLEQLHELRFLGQVVSTALFDLAANLGHFVLDICVLGRQVAYFGENRFRAVEVVVARFPAGGLGTPRYAQEKEKAGDELDSKRYNPLRLTLHINRPVARIIDPEAQHATALASDFENTDQASANGGRGGFGNVDGHNHGGGADTHAGDGTAGVDHVEGATGGGHEGAAEEKDGGGDDHGSFAADAFSEGEGEEGAEETASLGVVRFEAVGWGMGLTWNVETMLP